MPRATHRFIPIALAALALAVYSLVPPTANAAVRRCQGADGGTVYTDRRCEDVGAMPAPSGPVQARRSPPRAGCARNLTELVLRVSTAIGHEDPNQLAGVYHWSGMSGRQSAAVMRRLDGVVHRPLAGIVPVMRQASADMGEAISDAEYYARRPLDQRPVALRIEQSSVDGITPSHTVFGLQRHFDCWWIRG